jgi:FlaA1/EpsC-like NDP-sugar epimerase
MPKRTFDWYSRTNQILLDCFAFALSFTLAYAIRFEGLPSGADLRQFAGWLPIIVAARLFLYLGTGVYRRVWKFVSFNDAIEIAKSTAIVSFILVALRFGVGGNGPLAGWLRIPLSVIALDGLLALLGSLGLRGLRRSVYARQRRTAALRSIPRRVLLYGAGRAGIMLLKELETNHAYDVVGFIDDDPKKVGSIICNVRVAGNGDSLALVSQALRPDEIIVTMATASPATLAQALAKCQRANIPAKIIPSLKEILTGQVRISQLRETRIEEILGRESVEMPAFETVAGSAYAGKRILVTGAGGSIGSELVRQLTRLGPAEIAILDKDENSIYDLEQELKRRHVSARIAPQIADVRDAGRLRAIFERIAPEVVFHAAAHKHVPLMEEHPCEAVINNVAGTQNVIELAEEFGVQRFVFISSDKAVCPANVMGATKRIGELLVQASVGQRRTRFACVRFGNVLGSRGSVIPLFQNQIAAGGPVTVTHPEIVRYFMTIQEAVQLILCAGTIALGGETFVLDMGRPRNILEMARQMILLAGMEPGTDIEIAITGLRPGEKMFEELNAPTEELRRTHIEKLSVIEPLPRDASAFAADVRRLMQAARLNEREEVLEILQSMDLGFSQPAIKQLTAAAGAAASSAFQIARNPVTNIQPLPAD